jgi:hypothetical protein
LFDESAKNSDPPTDKPDSLFRGLNIEANAIDCDVEQRTFRKQSTGIIKIGYFFLKDVTLHAVPET